MQSFSISPNAMFGGAWRHRQLIWQMTRREVAGRYKGSILGLLWSFFNPVLMLAVYTFVFSVVFKARWNTGSDSKTEFAIVLFAGLAVYNLFAECINRAPNLVLGNPNYVKKVIFPLDILPWVALGASLFHTVISLGVLLMFYALVNHSLHWTVICLPLVMLPLMLLTLGVSWLLSSLGVYVRDVGQTVTLLTTVLMFLSPIFYPITSLPPAYRPWLQLNPLTPIIEQSRNVIVWGKLPELSVLGPYFLVALGIAWLGFAWFQKTRRGFADVM